MTEITVNDGQTLLDIALLYYGSTQAVVELCIDNFLEVGATLSNGQKLLIDPDKVIDSQIVSYYKLKNIIPSTKYTNE